jgi:cupin 2 domain-containing protein
MAIKVRNLFEEPDGTHAAPDAGGRSGLPEVFEPLIETSGLTVERIISHGAVSPKDFWYDQETDEWVMMARGGAVLEFEDEGLIAMKAGDHVMIPRRKKHRVLLTSRDAVWVAMHIRGPINVKVAKTRKKPAAKHAEGGKPAQPPATKDSPKSSKKAKNRT